MAEKVIKELILAKGKILAYEVTVQWHGGYRVGSDAVWLGNAMRHAPAMCKVLDVHMKGECLAPTALLWKAWEMRWDRSTGAWANLGTVELGGYEVIENGIFNNVWEG